MDPITLTFGLIGLGTSLAGSFGSSAVASETAQVSKDEAKQEKLVEDQRRQQMELQARRQQMENIRNTQRARALGLNAATSQGANLGSGLQGGQAGAFDTGLTNAVGINQNLEIGRNIFGLNAKISDDKMQLADLGSQAAMWQGVSNIGNSLFKAAPMLGALSGGGSKSGGGDYSGMPWSKNTGGLY